MTNMMQMTQSMARAGTVCRRGVRRGVAGAVVAAVVLGLGACGPADKQAAVRKVSLASRRAEIRRGTIVLSSSPEELPALAAAGAAVAAGGNSLAVVGLPVTMGVLVDVAHHRAALIAPASVASKVGAASAAGGPAALVLFDGAVTYVRRPTQGIVGARPWYRLDTSQLTQLSEPALEAMIAPRTYGDLAVISPITLLEQGSGLLTGSAQNKGVGRLAVAGDPEQQATHIEANTSLEKTTRSFHRDADRRRDTERLLRAFAAHDDINPAAAWLTADGRLARFDLKYLSRPDRGVRIGIRYSVVFVPVPVIAGPTDADLLVPPSAADSVGVTTLAQLRSALAQWFPAFKAPTIPGLATVGGEAKGPAA